MIGFVLRNITAGADFETRGFFFVPGVWQTLFEIVYETVSHLVFDNLNFEGEKYLPFICTLFVFILTNNLIGLLPYSFTVTSHLIVTFTLSLSIFIGVIIIGVIIICVVRLMISVICIGVIIVGVTVIGVVIIVGVINICVVSMMISVICIGVIIIGVIVIGVIIIGVIIIGVIVVIVIIFIIVYLIIIR
jgi:F0F1-type ATP synthase membrane subunit a